MEDTVIELIKGQINVISKKQESGEVSTVALQRTVNSLEKLTHLIGESVSEELDYISEEVGRLITRQASIVKKMQRSKNVNSANLERAVETLLTLANLIEIEDDDLEFLFEGSTKDEKGNITFLSTMSGLAVFPEMSSVLNDTDIKEISEDESQLVSDALDNSLKWYKKMSDSLEKKILEDIEFIRNATDSEIEKYIDDLTDSK